MIFLELEIMKMWTDAYVSLILSGVLVIIIGVVSTMIWKGSTAVKSLEVTTAAAKQSE